ncbi:MAG: aldehyde dehydrogenase family protein [bacterium]
MAPATLQTFPLHIANQPVEDGGELVAVHAPWDGALIGQVQRAGPTELEQAMEAAANAAPILLRQPAHERQTLLREIRAGLEARQDEFASMIAWEVGKPIRYARAEVTRALGTLKIAEEEAGRIGGEVVPLDWAPHGADHVAFTRQFPLGPVIGISPFNFPLNLMMHKVAPAIAAGCPILHKPASSGAVTAWMFDQIVREAGALPGQVQIVPMSVATAEWLVTDPRFKALSFTGSPEVGWVLKAQAGHKKITLELGGNASAILAPDADLNDALPRCVEAAYSYAGQVCISLQRLFVHESQYDTVRARLILLVEAVKSGDPADPSTVNGPLITTGDADRIEEWIAAAVTGGATLLTGGARSGQIISAALLDNVDPEAALSCREAFGPVLILERYSEFAEACARINASRYGLQASVFTRDLGLAMQAHQTLHVGGVMINEPPTYRVDSMPYGGVKLSGLGREGVKYAIEEFTEPRLCVMRW